MVRKKPVLGELISFKNTRGLDLDGILYQDDSNKTTIIHVHGSLGNFYQNEFLRLMARMYLDAGINLLSFNLAGHDGLAEGYRNDEEYEYIGGSAADFGECIYDIEGAINFSRQYTDHIILQGHSLGCDRVLYFLLSQVVDYDFILLGPCDSYQLHCVWIAPETVEQQIVRLKAQALQGNELDWLPISEYGIKQGEYWTYNIPVTRKALLAIMEGPPFQLIRMDSPAQFSLKQRALIYIGGNDVLQTASVETMFRYFEERIGEVKKVYIQNSDHNLIGGEHEIIKQIIEWTQA